VQWRVVAESEVEAQSSHFEKLARTYLGIYGPRAGIVYEIGTDFFIGTQFF